MQIAITLFLIFGGSAMFLWVQRQKPRSGLDHLKWSAVLFISTLMIFASMPMAGEILEELPCRVAGIWCQHPNFDPNKFWLTWR